MRIDCGECTLRLWRRGDEDSLVRHANDRGIWLNLRDGFPYPYTRADAEKWIEIASAPEPQTHFAIEVGGEAAGGIGFVLQDDIARVSAELGYWLGRPFWGRGVMSAAVRRATQHAFETFPLTHVYAMPFAHNTASIRVLEKCGYTREGVLRRHVVKDGVILDQMVHGMTDLDWKHFNGAGTLQDSQRDERVGHPGLPDVC